MENRLISASGAKNAQLKYDPLGRLYETNNGSGGAVTRFLYDGDALVAEYNSAGTMLHRYVHGNGVDQPLVWYDGGTVNATNRRHLFANWQGSITAITDASGNAVQVNAYDAYGIPNDTNLGRFQYTGQIIIPELGIYHYKARAYSPYLGRFLQTDPIGYEDQFNLYAYVGNDPVGRADPSGETGKAIVGGFKLTLRVQKLTSKGVSFEKALKIAAEEFGQDFATDWNAIGNDSSASFMDQLAATADILVGTSLNNEDGSEDSKEGAKGGAEHKKGARPSTKGKHDKGQTRKKREQEKAAASKPKPKVKGPPTRPPKDSPEYLRPGPKPKNPKD